MSQQRMLSARTMGALAASLACAGVLAATTAAGPAPTAARAAVPASGATLPAAPSPATPMVDACPKELSVRQAVVADIAGWTSVSPQESYPFARIAFYSGPPSDDKRVVPAFEHRTATGLHDGWMLRRQPAGYWLQCQYANTAAVVIRRLDDANDFCVADYDPHFSSLVVKHWACMPGKLSAKAALAGTARPSASRPRLSSSGLHGS